MSKMNGANILNRLLKKNKKLVVSVLSLILMGLAELSTSFVYRQYKTLDEVKSATITNHHLINNLTTNFKNLDIKTSNIVTRNSFNAYINRVDTEYHSQAFFNDKVSNQLGNLRGEISVIKQIVYNMHTTYSTCYTQRSQESVSPIQKVNKKS